MQGFGYGWGAVAIAALLAGCYTPTTPPAEVRPTYVPAVRYEPVPCDRLAAEVAVLSKREAELIVAQQDRLDRSFVQQIFFAPGLGDGLEASELASVRGELTAIRSAQTSKGCAPAAK